MKNIGVDDGHDSIKVCTGFDEAAEKYLCTTIKSQAMLGVHQIVSMGSMGSSAYSSNGEEFTILSDNALGVAMDTRFLQYPTSNLNRVLVQHSLLKAGLAGEDVFVISGLPVDQYYQAGKQNKALIDKKLESLQINVASLDKSVESAAIKGGFVVSEGIAVIYDLLFDGKGAALKEMSELVARRPVAVIDMGGKTLDIATVMEGLAGVYQPRSGTENLGAIDLKRNVAAAIKAKFSLNNEPPLKYIDEAFVTKQYEFFGEKHDVSDIVETNCWDYLKKVKNAFLTKLGDGSDLGAAIFSGGGAALLMLALGNDVFKNVYSGRIILPAEPEYANARGNWKAGEFVFGASISKQSPVVDTKVAA